jgi:hypothetical protein
MTDQTNRLTQWVINKIKTEYPDDIALLVAIEGSSVNNDGHGEPFDYFIPATERGNDLAQTFIIDGVGNDLYPRSWERTERTANLEDSATLCLGSAVILYARTKEDEKRFEAIRQKLFDNLANPEFIYKKALENLDIAMDLYRTMMFEESLWKIKCHAGFIHYYLMISVACLNGTYWKEWSSGALPAISKWAALPNNFAEYYEAILASSSSGELKSLAHLLITATRQFIAQYKPEGLEKITPNYAWLAEWYQELRTTWKRIYYYCEIDNADAAFVDACNLQNELNIIKEDFALNEIDLLGYFDINDLKQFKQRAEVIEQMIVSIIEEQGIKIKRYDSLDEFLIAEK